VITTTRRRLAGFLVVGVMAAGLAVASFAVPVPASAHVRATEGTSVIRQDGSTVRVDTTLEYDLVVAAAGLGTPPADDARRSRLLEDRHDRLAGYLTDRISVSLDGVECEGELLGAELVRQQGTAYARGSLEFGCPGTPTGDYLVRWDVFSTRDAVVDNHTNVTDYQLGDATGTFVFDGAHRELEAGQGHLVSTVARFVTMGVEHILGGIDHVLFLVVLLLGARGLASLVKVATSFTVAHSLTLALGVVGWVEVPPEVVEPLIALSIAYVAVENILGGESRHRLAVVFGFGLLHGLGFASTLTFTDDLSPRLLGSLVSFNAGIELGQLLIIGMLFPLLVFIRRFNWSAIVHTVATAGAAIIGLVWFLQRLVF
jgi:HupE / UreJ protein